jgi:hypothetical protein
MIRRKLSRKLSIILTVNLLLVLLLANFDQTYAAGASFLFSPATGSYTVGSSFNINVMLNSGGGIGINAGEATVSFPKDLLQVKSLSQTGSIFELWTAKPSFSNNKGTITFGGGLPDVYKGSAGKIFSISFSALKEGTANLSFSGGVITARDGLGTNVYSGAGSGKYTITPKQATTEKPPDTTKPPTTETTAPGLLPPAPEINSATHPNQDQWYAKNTLSLDWRLLSSITGVSFVLTDNASSAPGTKSDGIIESKTYEKLEDGKYYFHLHLQNKSGWGPIARRHALIDVSPPVDLKLEIDNGGDATNPTPLLKISAEDKTSGLKKYKLTVNKVDKELEVKNYIAEPYLMEKLLPGNYSALIIAYDQADNSATSSLNFVIEALKPPMITDIPKEIKTGEDFTVRGVSFYPLETIKLYVSNNGAEPKVYDTKTDENGDWNYYHQERLPKGNYQIWAKVVKANGAESFNSLKQILYVVSPSIITAYGLYIIILLIIIIIVLVLYIIYLRKTFAEEKKRILIETLEAKKKVNEIFVALQEEVDELIVYADKKPGLSESEKRVKEKIKEALDISEEFLTKEVEDIEKELAVVEKKKK